MYRSSLAALIAVSLALTGAAQAQTQSLLMDKKDLTPFAARKIMDACFAVRHSPLRFSIRCARR